MSADATAAQRAHIIRMMACLAVAACAVAGAATALDPAAGLIVAAGLAGMAAACAVVGIRGAILLLPAASSFVLLNRFDDLLSIPVGETLRMTTVYWLCAACLGLLVLSVGTRPRAASGDEPLRSGFVYPFSIIVGLFALAGLVSIAFNHAFDTYFPQRDLRAELLALGAIVIPMGLAAVIPALSLTKRQTLACIRVLIALGVVTGVIMAVFGLASGWVIARLGWLEAAFGTLDVARGRTPLGHPNIVGAVMAMLLPLVIVLGFRARVAILRPLYLFGAAVMLCGTVFTLSRGVLAATSLIVLITAAYLLYSGRTPIAWRLVGVFAAVGLLAVAATYLVSHYDFSRFWSHRYHESESVTRRLDSMQTALVIWRDFPVYGMSPGVLYPRTALDPLWVPEGIDQVSYVIHYRGRVSAPHPHNAFLMLLAEFGVLGTAAFLAGLGLMGWRFVKASAWPGLSSSDASMMAGFTLAFFALLLMSLPESLLLNDVRSNVVFWTLLGLGMRYAVAAREEASQ